MYRSRENLQVMKYYEFGKVVKKEMAVSDLEKIQILYLLDMIDWKKENTGWERTLDPPSSVSTTNISENMHI